MNTVRYNEHLCSLVREGKLAIEYSVSVCSPVELNKILSYIFPEHPSYAPGFKRYYFANEKLKGTWNSLNITTLAARPVSDFYAPTDTGKEVPQEGKVRSAMGVQKTALQELIDYLISQKKQFEPMAYGFLMNRCITLLDKEREQHYDTFVAGSERGTKDIPFNAEQYFTQTFKHSPLKLCLKVK